MVLIVNNLSKMYGHIPILHHVSFVVNAGERIGLVGANGAGKSTLLKIIMGEIPSDSGSVVVADSIEPGYVPQTIAPCPDQTIAELLAASQRRLRLLEQRMHALAEHLATAQGAARTAALAEYGEVATRFEQAGGYDLEYKIALVLDGLRLSHLPRDRPLASLSGGEKTRVALAALLLRSPDVLLLDEPTSHLDSPTAEWLETYLRQQSGAVLAVSHDRQFLNRIATRIIELDEHTHAIHTYGGNYDTYAAQKQQERQAWAAAYAQQQEEIKALQQAIRATPQRLAQKRAPRDNDKLGYNFFGGRVQRAISRNIRAAEQALAAIHADAIPRPPEPLHFLPRFQPGDLPGGTALTATDISHTLPNGQVLLNQVTCELGPTSRIMLVGDNGAGKTTLLRILAGQLTPTRGTVMRAAGISIGYLTQEVPAIRPEQTVLQAYRADRTGYEQDHLAELLRYDLFTYEETSRSLPALSAGQYRKLQLARLMATQANVLLLDEPSNYLSLAILEQFEHALHAFPGTIIAVSHDRWFIQQFGGEVWRLAGGRLLRD